MYNAPNRDQLARVFGSHELIKAFEALFRDVGREFPEAIADLTIRAAALRREFDAEVVNAGATAGAVQTLLALQARARDQMMLALLSPAQVIQSPAGSVAPAMAPYTHPNFTL